MKEAALVVIVIFIKRKEHNMKKLNLFRDFNWERFSADKTFACTGVKYSEFKQMLMADVVIVSDKTDYSDATVSNLFEKFKVSMPGTTEADIARFTPLVNQQCVITNVQKVSVYGDYSDKLSVVAMLAAVKGQQQNDHK